MRNFTESLKLHDKYQIEMKFTYPLDRSKRINEYHVDTFFFIPTNLSINSMTYSKTDFYNDMYDYIRLKTPTVRLSVMTSGEDAPMRKLERAMTDLAEKPESAEKSAYAERIKMFCSIMRSALRDEEAFLEHSRDSRNFRTLAERYLKTADEVVSEFRSMRIILEDPLVPENAMELFRHVDEYLSLTLNKYRYKLWLFLDQQTTIAGTDDLKMELLRALRFEIDYRKLNRYPAIPDPNGENEELVYRESCLKKAMASVLFLKTNIRRDGVLLENLVFGIAAGLAMTFATAIAYLTRSFFLQEFSLFFFASIVIAYMCKDRIKELSRAYLYSKVKRFIYDYKTTISSELGKVVGLCKESFNFLQESDLHDDIRRIRHKGYLTDMENGCFGEKIILARKQVSLNSDECKNIFTDFNVDGIVDIMRFNVRKFLWKMDNPVKPVHMPDENGKIITINAKRVYHLNIVVKYGMEGQKDSYARFRVILSRNGIKRIDTFPVVVGMENI